MTQNKRGRTKAMRTNTYIGFENVKEGEKEIVLISNKDRAIIQHLRSMNIDSPEKLEKFIFFRMWLKLRCFSIALGKMICLS